MNEWPLLIFTLSIQAAIGGIFMLWVFQLINRRKNLDLQSLFKLPLIIIGALSIIGLAASFAHLGAPINAFNTIRHIGSSWMSREILVTGTFIGLSVLNVAWLLYRKKVLPWLLIVTAIVGFVDVYCMAAIYTHSLVGPWNSVNTFMSFYGTTLILGAVLVVALLTTSLYRQGMELEVKQFMRVALITALAGFGFHIIGTALYTPEPTEVTIVSSTISASVMATYKFMTGTRWVISILGVTLLGYLALSSYKRSYTILTILTLIVFVLSEGMSRYVFYLIGS